MAAEFDLVRMEGSESPAKLIDVRKAPSKFFSSANLLAEARSACKRAKFLHFNAYDADVGLMKACAINGCTLVMAVTDLLNLKAGEKAKKLARMKRFAALANHFFAKVKVATLARNEYELRSGFELRAVAELLGMAPGQAKAMGGMNMPA